MKRVTRDEICWAICHLKGPKNGEYIYQENCEIKHDQYAIEHKQSDAILTFNWNIHVDYKFIVATL